MGAPPQVQGEAAAEAQSQSRGRITIYCIAETLNRELLSRKLRARGPSFQLHVRLHPPLCHQHPYKFFKHGHPHCQVMT